LISQIREKIDITAYFKNDATEKDILGAKTELLKLSSEVREVQYVSKEEALQILSQAIEAESQAYNRYREMADKTDDPDGKELFKKLADEENVHRRILSDEFYHLNNKGGIWSLGD
jgi:rubrerythrin